MEYLLEGFAKEATDPATLAAMAAGGAVYRSARLAAMCRLAGRPGVLGRGAGLKLAGGLIGFAAEAPTFTAVGRWGRGVALSEAGLGRELLSSYIVLGGLKGMGGLAERVSRTARHPGLSSWAAHGGMYGGVMMGHALEAAAGLKEWRFGGIEWAEGLALMLQLKVSGKLLHVAGGPRHSTLERELGFRAVRLAEWSAIDRMRPANDGNYPVIAPAANGPHRAAEERPWALAVGAELQTAADAMPPRGVRRFQVFGSHGDSNSGPPPRPAIAWHPNGIPGPPPARERATSEPEAPSPRFREATRPVETLLVISRSPRAMALHLRIFRSEHPLGPDEAVYRLKSVFPDTGTAELELDPLFKESASPAPETIVFELNDGLKVRGRERFVLDAAAWNARKTGASASPETSDARPADSSYAWGVQRAARLEPRPDSPNDFTLWLDDLAPMRDAEGKDTPFLILGRGDSAFGSGHFRDPSVSREHLKIFFPDRYWMREGGQVDVENLSPNFVWYSTAELGMGLMNPGRSEQEPEPQFLKLGAGDQVAMGPYTLTLAFKRGLSAVGGEREPKKPLASDVPPSRPRPLENIALRPEVRYELGRWLRPTSREPVAISLAQPFIAARHLRLRYEAGQDGRPGTLYAEHVPKEGGAMETPAMFTTDHGKAWSAPDLEGMDRDLAMPEAAVGDLLEPQVWVHEVGGKDADWQPLPRGTPHRLPPGSLIALGRLGRPTKIFHWTVDSLGHRDIVMLNLPWDLSDALVYQFSETPAGGMLSLYGFEGG